MARTADNVEMQGIEFQIINDSDEATNSIERLGKALSELKINVKGGISAVSRAGNSISKLRTALDGIDTAGIADKLKGVSDAVNKLNIDPSAKISSSLPKNITALNAAVASIQTDKITQLGSALQAIANSSGAKISATLPKNITALNTAISGLEAGAITKLSGLAAGLKPLGELDRAKLSSFITQLGELPAVIQELDKVDLDKFTQQMKDFAEAIRPLADEMNKVAAGFSAFPARIQRLITSTEQYNSVTRNAAQNTNTWNRALKTLSFAAIYRGISKFLASAISKASEYQEDLNLFTVSMGEYAEEAYNYAQTVSEIVGIDPSEWMRNQGVFNTIISGFGVAGEKAAFMSKNLTQLSYDLASFYNLDFESAMQKVQSGIAGELEPLRRLGYDLSVARLEQERLNLGIDKSVSSMTQAEKSQLRYYAMMTQVTQVQGDMARTLEQPANMLRVLQSQLEQASRAIGNLFIPVLTKVLPIAIAVASALREIIAAIAALFGVTLNTPEWGDSIGSATAGTGAIADNMDSAAGSAKELKKYIAGFDELNVLPDQNQGGGSGGSAGAGGGDLGIELPGYDFLENAVGNKIDEWKKKLEPLVTFVKDNLKEILELVATIGTALLAWKLTNEFMTGISALKALSQNGLSIPLTITAGAILTATGFKIEFSGIKDAIEKSLNGFNFAEIILGGITGVGGMALIGKGIGAFIARAFSGSAVAQAITAGGGAISTGLIGAAIGGIVAGIPMFVTGVYDAIMNGLNWLNGLLIPAGSTLAGAGIGAIIGSLGGPIGAGIGAIIGLVVGGLTDIGLAISDHWESIKSFFEKAFASVSNAVENRLIAPIKEKVKPLSDWIKQFSEGCWIIVQAVWSVASDWVNETFVQPVSALFNALKDSIATALSNAWASVKNVWASAVSWFKELTAPIVSTFTSAWNSIVTGFETVAEGIKNIARGMFNGIISTFESMLNSVISGINVLIRAFNSVASWGASIIGASWSGLSEISTVTVQRYASGGFPDQGQIFIAREAGAEMVGSIGRRTTVANNDQIVEGITNGVREGNDDVVNALYAVAQQIIMEMREQDRNGGGGNYDFDRAVADAQRRNARMYG